MLRLWNTCNEFAENNSDFDKAVAAEEAQRADQESLKRSNSLEDVVMNAHKIINKSPPPVDTSNLVKVVCVLAHE